MPLGNNTWTNGRPGKMSRDLKEASDWLILEVKFLLRFKLRGLNINIGDLNLP